MTPRQHMLDTATLAPPDLAAQEWRRLEILHSYAIAGTEPEPEFDAFVAEAASALDVPIAVLSFVDSKRTWFKARYGSDLTSLPHEASICRLGVDRKEAWSIPNLSANPATAGIPGVASDTQPGIAAYAAAPLLTNDGHVIGMLCAIDTHPREFTTAQLRTLRGLAERAMDSLEMRKRRSDTSSQHGLSEELAAAEERWRLTLDHAPLGMAMVCPNAGFLRANQAFGDIVGHHPDLLLTMKITDLASEHDRAKIVQMLDAGVDASRQLHAQFVHAWGHQVWVSVSAAPVRGRDGKPTYFVLHLEDTSDREHDRQELAAAHAELSSRQAFLSTLMDTADVGIVACDVSGHITLVNHTMSRWCGVTPGTEPARAPQLNPFAALLHRALNELTLRGVLSEVTSASGFVREVSSQGRATLDAQGNIIGAVLSVTDITAPRRRQREMLAAQRELAERTEELQRSNRDLEDFASVASHDLRAPLGTVKGYLELLVDQYASVLDDRAFDYVARIEGSLTRMTGLMDSLLAHAASTDPREVYRGTSVVNVHEALDAVLADLQPELTRYNATVTCDAPAGTLAGDPELIRQLLQNLVANAARHAGNEPGSEDGTSECSIHVTVVKHDDQDWLLSVADSGPGIPPSKRDEVFAMFGRAGLGAGHGIGLATCRRIAERHGGKIWISETPGGGATFNVSICHAPE